MLSMHGNERQGVNVTFEQQMLVSDSDINQTIISYLCLCYEAKANSETWWPVKQSPDYNKIK